VDWCLAQRIAIGYIQPGKPDQNAFIERFNRTFREEVLDAYLFDSLDQVREITDAWLANYNTEQLHSGLAASRAPRTAGAITAPWCRSRAVTSAGRIGRSSLPES
jgi:putative transposase